MVMGISAIMNMIALCLLDLSFAVKVMEVPLLGLAQQGFGNTYQQGAGLMERLVKIAPK